MAHLKLWMNTTVLMLIAVSCMNIDTQAAVVWNGPATTFTKVDFADSTQAANQDRITDNVWITRGNTKGLFNAKTESFYTATSPADTEWAYGTTANLGSLTFTSWFNWASSFPPGTVGQDAVLHLISDDIYIDIKLLSWSSGGSGGGFSYERSTVPEPATIAALVGMGSVILARRRKS